MAKEQRNLVGIKEGWSEFTLDDGTVVRIKAMMTDAVSTGNYDDEGNPEYTFTVVNSIRVDSPEPLKLKRGAPTAITRPH